MKKLDFECAGFDWPSAGDDRILIERPAEKDLEVIKKDASKGLKVVGEWTPVVPPSHANCLCIPIPLPAVDSTMKDLALEKLVDVQREIQRMRRDRWLWFAWGAGLSPWLAAFLRWLTG